MLLKNTDINKRTVNILKKKKIYTEDDLVRLVPRDYKDYRKIYSITDAPLDTWCAVCGVITNVQLKSGQRNYLSIRIYSTDRQGMETSFSIFMFSRTFLYEEYFRMIGHSVVITGKVKYDQQYGWSMSEPDAITDQKRFIPRIEPIYTKMGGISDGMLKRIIHETLQKVQEPFEWELMQKIKVEDYKSALYQLHFPNTGEDIKEGKKRLLLNDLLFFAMSLKQNSMGKDNKTPVLLKEHGGLDSFLSSLPYSLTADQQSVLDSLCADASHGRHINTLVQGDVGSGKTVLAVAMMVLAADNGYQSVLMAPRGVLAGQHYASVREMTEVGEDEIVYLHNGLKSAEKKKALKKIETGEAKYIVGTHSCLSDSVVYHNLGLIITDEEHLFGVRQKEGIVKKAKEGAHVLSMSATPIPRTLAGVIYGEDKAVEQIRTMPNGRLPIKTAIVKDRPKAMDFMLKEIKTGHQCYVVCPAIEDNENSDLISIESVGKEYRTFFYKYGIQAGVINGKMEKKEADAIMQDFASGVISVLISTTVVEVGVNVPNSTVIVIEQAERFGMASLHQLRGRVGRGKHQSYCILRSDETANKRLKTIAGTTDGFAIAEADLQMRGSGDLLGTDQAGLNRYVSLMLAYPLTWKRAKKIADFCLEKGYGKKLMDLYLESDTEETKPVKKGKKEKKPVCICCGKGPINASQFMAQDGTSYEGCFAIDKKAKRVERI